RRWRMGRAGRTLAALGRNNVWMKARMNRYYLSLWDVGKRSLYGRETKSVQAATLAGGFMEGTWRTPLQPRRNKTWRSCPGRKVFLRSAHSRFAIRDPAWPNSASRRPLPAEPHRQLALG